LEVRYYDTDGDLFYHLAGQVKPPETPTLLSAHTIRTDENGFRLPAQALPAYADYPVLVLGDSFSDAWMVARPWPDVLAEASGQPVLNLAFRGYGPSEYVAIMRRYGASASRQWVLLAYFEGNDLQNIARTERGDNLLANLARDTLRPARFSVQTSPNGQYRYPLALYIGSDFYELAFYDPYIWILNAERPVYAQSQNMARLGQLLGEVKTLAGQACVGLVYLPTKAHIYFQYIEPYGRRWILENGSESVLDEAGWLAEGERQVVDFETLLGRMDNQREAVRAVVEAQGLLFIDMTAPMQSAAAQSQMLYLTYDTHWSQAGHELAGQVVAEVLAGGCEG
jgi:hypothetical protein